MTCRNTSAMDGQPGALEGVSPPGGEPESILLISDRSIRLASANSNAKNKWASTKSIKSAATCFRVEEERKQHAACLGLQTISCLGHCNWPCASLTSCRMTRESWAARSHPASKCHLPLDNMPTWRRKRNARRGKVVERWEDSSRSERAQIWLVYVIYSSSFLCLLPSHVTPPVTRHHQERSACLESFHLPCRQPPAVLRPHCRHSCHSDAIVNSDGDSSPTEHGPDLTVEDPNILNIPRQDWTFSQSG